MTAHPAPIPQLEDVVARLAALEKRISALEHPQAPVDSAVFQPTFALAPESSPPPVTSASSPSLQLTSTLSLFGASLLGIAGAYVLRALSGASLVPRGVIAALAAIYAAAWLIAAARAAARPLAATLYAITSALILAPMLWEMTIRFHAMPASVAALILIAYTGLTTALALRASHSAVFVTAYAGSALTALVLSVATHFMAPFAALLLAMLAVCQFTRPGSTAPALRALIALIADVSVWAVIFIYRLPPDSRIDYPALSLAVVIAGPALLFALQCASVFLDILRREQPITIFQALQSMIALAMLACALFWLLPGVAAALIGAFCLLLSALCHALCYSRFRRAEQLRNFRVFAVWAEALCLGGLYLLVPQTVLSAAVGILGLAAIVLAARLRDRMRDRTLEFQGVLFLTIGAVASGVLLYGYNALAGIMPGLPQWPVITAILCAVLACSLPGERGSGSALSVTLQFIPAFLASFGAAAIGVRCLTGLLSLFLAPGVFHIAFLRTLALCALSIALAWIGARFGRLHFTRVAYCALAAVAAKLLLEDLRHGHLEFIAASIGLVALTLIIVPRIARTPSRLAA